MSYDLEISTGKGTREQQLLKLKNALASCDAVLVGAGAGLSTSAGLSGPGGQSPWPTPGPPMVRTRSSAGKNPCVF